jgi:purine-binding chemotaxis protein CheW
VENIAKTLQTFRVGTQQFAVRESEIATVVDWRTPTPLPHAPVAVMGVVSLQGRMLTVLDIGKLIEGEDTTESTPQHIIALRGDEQLALAVKGIDGVIEASEELVERKSNDSGLTLGVLNHQGQRIEIVNVKGLFPLTIQGRERRQRQF